MAKVNLHSLLQTLHDAVIGAQEVTERQHIDQLLKYFEWPEGEGIDSEQPDQTTADQINHLLAKGKPKMIRIEVPNMHPDAPIGDMQTLQIPLMSLIPPSSLRIKNVVMEFKVALGELDSREDKRLLGQHMTTDVSKRDALRIDLGGVSGGFFTKKTQSPIAKVKIEFEAGEPSESFLRINDHLIKSIV